jgi:hypothetical protein
MPSPTTGRPTGDPIKSLIFLQTTVEKLFPLVAEILFTIESDELVQKFPDHVRPSVQILVWQGMLNYPPIQRLAEFRKIRKDLTARSQARKLLAASRQDTQTTDD